MTTRRLLLSGTVASLVAAVLVPAAHANPRPRDGIAHAKAAGMYIDPRAERWMARAPIGSCANDPTLSTCPPSHAVIHISNPSAALWAQKGSVARAAQINQCAIRVSDQSPYKAAGFAQMNAANQCSPAVQYQELYGYLYKYYKKWVVMNETVSYGVGGQTIRVHTTYDCTANVLRAWEALGVGYDEMEGVWYTGSQTSYGNLNCG